MQHGKIGRASALLAAAFALSLALGACEEEGAMENAGEQADEAVEGAGDAAEDATD